MKKIKVQSKLSPFFAILLSVICMLIATILIYIATTSDFISPHVKNQIIGFFGAIAIGVPIWIKNMELKEEYVSDLFIDKTFLGLIYKQGKNIRIEKIPLKEITSFKATLEANNIATGKHISIICKTFVIICAKNRNPIVFMQNPAINFSFCNYSFLLRLLDNAKYIPNFSYKIEGNSNICKQDIRNYVLNGKRLPFYQRELLILKQYPLISKIIFALFLIPFVIFLCMVIFK